MRNLLCFWGVGGTGDVGIRYDDADELERGVLIFGQRGVTNGPFPFRSVHSSRLLDDLHGRFERFSFIVIIGDGYEGGWIPEVKYIVSWLRVGALVWPIRWFITLGNEWAWMI